MTDTLKPSPTSGSKGSASTPKTSAKPNFVAGGNVIVRLKSLLDAGGDLPGLGLYVPPAGEVFEAEAWQAKALTECKYAVIAGETAKGE